MNNTQIEQSICTGSMSFLLRIAEINKASTEEKDYLNWMSDLRNSDNTKDETPSHC